MAEDLQRGERVKVHGRPGVVRSVSEDLRAAKVDFDQGGQWDGDVGYVHRERWAYGTKSVQEAIAAVRKRRIDAENPERDELAGIDMLRNWLRGLHMELVGGWGQDTSQDVIADLLGEYPRDHPRFAKIDPDR